MAFPVRLRGNKLLSLKADMSFNARNVVQLIVLLITSSNLYFCYHIMLTCIIPVKFSLAKNSPTLTHACSKRRLKWVTTLPLGDINTEAWASGMGVGRGANNPTM
jgi:hypothetical protein